jgi:hypothetical protein
MKSILKKSKYNIPIQEDDSELRLTYIVYKFWYFFSWISSEKIYKHDLTSEESLNNRLDRY